MTSICCNICDFHFVYLHVLLLAITGCIVHMLPYGLYLIYLLTHVPQSTTHHIYWTSRYEHYFKFIKPICIHDEIMTLITLVSTSASSRSIEGTRKKMFCYYHLLIRTTAILWAIQFQLHKITLPYLHESHRQLFSFFNIATGTMHSVLS